MARHESEGFSLGRPPAQEWKLPEARITGGILGNREPNNVMDAYFEPAAWWLRKRQSSHHATASKRVITGVRSQEYETQETKDTLAVDSRDGTVERLEGLRFIPLL